MKKQIFEDSRQKPEKNKYIRDQLERLGYTVIRTKLYVGDYTWATDQRICVDTKQDLCEVCANVVQDHERFRNECIRAQEAGIQLIVLIADDSIENLSSVWGWKNPRRYYSKRATTGKTLAKILYSLHKKYNVRFEFAKREEIGSRIVELLGE